MFKNVLKKKKKKNIVRDSRKYV